MKIFNKIKDFILKNKQIILLFLGASFIFRIIYVRLIKQYHPSILPRNLLENQQYYHVVFYAIMVFSFMYLIFINIKTILGKQPNRRIKLSQSLEKLLKESLEITNRTFLEKTFMKHYIGQWLETTGLFFYKKCNTSRRKFAILFLGYILPKTIVLLSFVVDVFLYNEFNFVLKFSVLLIIPLVTNYILYLIQYYCEENFEELDSILFITDFFTKMQLTTKDIFAGSISIPKKHQENFVNVALTEKFINEYITNSDSKSVTVIYYNNLLREFLIPIKTFEYDFDKYYVKKYLPYFHTILYTSYAVCWGYILYFGW